MNDWTVSLNWINTWLDEISSIDEGKAHTLSEAAERYRIFTHSKENVHLGQAIGHRYQALECGSGNADHISYYMRSIVRMSGSMYDASSDDV